MADEFTPKTPTSVLVVGPHCLLERNGVVFNDRTERECYWVDEFSGFDKADIRASAQENVQETGELPDPSFYGGRTMTMTGWIQAGSYPKLLEMHRALIDSLIDLGELDMTIAVLNASSWFNQPSVTIACSPSDYNIATKIEQPDVTSGLIKRQFTVALRASDPTYKGIDTKTLRLTPLIFQAYGRAYDRTYDVSYSTPLIAGIPTDTNIGVALNAGNWPARPTLTFNGGMMNVKFDNTTNGQTIELTAPVSTGDCIKINTRTGDITDKLGNHEDSIFDPTSDWMQLVGKRDNYDGNNDLSISVTWFDASAYVDIAWQDTYL